MHMGAAKPRAGGPQLVGPPRAALAAMLPTAVRSPPGSPSAAAAAKAGGIVLPAPRCMARLIGAVLCTALLVVLYNDRWAPPAAPVVRVVAPCPEQVLLDSAVGSNPGHAAPTLSQPAAPSAEAAAAAATPRPTSLLVEPPPVRWPDPIIPKLIHQTWKGRDKSKPLPGWVQSSVNSWKSTNPGYVHKMHDDNDIEHRVKTLHPELLPAYEQMKPIQRADLFRYMVLYDEGGYYADCDVDCTQPIDSWVGQYEPRSFYDVHFIAGLEIVTNGKAVREHWFAREFQFVQWTMGAAPGHPILAGVLRNIQEYFAAGKHKEGTKSIIKSTGPGIWSDAITQHVEAQYGIQFGEGEEEASDDKGPFSHRKMHHKGAHIGDVLCVCLPACVPACQLAAMCRSSLAWI